MIHLGACVASLVCHAEHGKLSMEQYSPGIVPAGSRLPLRLPCCTLFWSMPAFIHDCLSHPPCLCPSPLPLPAMYRWAKLGRLSAAGELERTAAAPGALPRSLAAEEYIFKVGRWWVCGADWQCCCLIAGWVLGLAIIQKLTGALPPP